MSSKLGDWRGERCLLKEPRMGASLPEDGGDNGFSRGMGGVGSSKRMKSFCGPVILAMEVIAAERQANVNDRDEEWEASRKCRERERSRRR